MQTANLVDKIQMVAIVISVLLGMVQIQMDSAHRLSLIVKLIQETILWILKVIGIAQFASQEHIG